MHIYLMFDLNVESEQDDEATHSADPCVPASFTCQNGVILKTRRVTVQSIAACWVNIQRGETIMGITRSNNALSKPFIVLHLF